MDTRQTEELHIPLQKLSLNENNVSPKRASEQPCDHAPSAKMLIFLENGEQKLITFTLTKESCPLAEILEQENIPFSDDTHVEWLQNTTSEIDYFVVLGRTVRIEDLLENHPLFRDDAKGNS